MMQSIMAPRRSLSMTFTPQQLAEGYESQVIIRAPSFITETTIVTARIRLLVYRNGLVIHEHIHLFQLTLEPSLETHFLQSVRVEQDQLFGTLKDSMLNINLAVSKRVVKDQFDQFTQSSVAMLTNIVAQAGESLQRVEDIVTEYGLDTRYIDEMRQFISNEIDIFDNNINSALSLLANVNAGYSQGATIPEPSLKNVLPKDVNFIIPASAANQMLIQAPFGTLAIGISGSKGLRFTRVEGNIAFVEQVNVDMQASAITVAGQKLGPFTIAEAGGSRGTLNLQTGLLNMDYYYKVSSPTLPPFVLNVKTTGVISPIADLRTFLVVNKYPQVTSNLIFFDYEYAIGLLPEFLPFIGGIPIRIYAMHKPPTAPVEPAKPPKYGITVTGTVKKVTEDVYWVVEQPLYSIDITLTAEEGHEIHVTDVWVQGSPVAPVRVPGATSTPWGTTHTITVQLRNPGLGPFKKNQSLSITVFWESRAPGRVTLKGAKVITLIVDP